MSTHYHERTIYNFIVGDFEDAWNSLALRPVSEARHRGNFMFALLAMVLLEWVGHLCNNDSSARRDFSEKLNDIDKKYFTRLPWHCILPDFKFPSYGPDPSTELLATLFDLIRNGQAHQYQQVTVALPAAKGGGTFRVGLTSATNLLNRVKTESRDPKHLGYRKQGKNIVLRVRTDWLFLDLKEAIKRAKLLNRGLGFSGLTRGGTGRKGRYDSDANTVALALGAFGHAKL